MNPTQRARVLVVDDEADIRAVLVEMVTGYEIRAVRSGKEALSIITGPEAARPAIILLDVGLEDMDGTEILQTIKDQGIEIPVVLMTGQGRGSAVILGSQLGAVEPLSKPFEIAQVEEIIERVLRQSQQRRVHQSAATGEELPSYNEKIIGRGRAMLDVFHRVGQVARTPTTVMITGETGTGKTLLAETVHRSSDRRRGPFLDLNCAGIPETLLEGELFGHEAGAYTGANKARAGHFESANGGTIFLDEIGDMTLATQVKLLKVLDKHEVIRLGSSKSTPVDVRVITATHRNLAREVLEGRFRADLYYRLNAYPIRMPSLRERRDDMNLLVAHFLKKYRIKPAMPPAEISTEALEKLSDYDWPGNVRELENVVQRAVISSQGELILPEHIILDDELGHYTLDIAQLQRQGYTLDKLLHETQRMALLSAILRSQGDHHRIAQTLGLEVNSVIKLRQELGV